MIPLAAGEPLRWNVSRLLMEPPGSTRDLLVSGVTIPLDDELRLADPIDGRVRLARTNRGLLVTGDLTAGLDSTCGRCLRPVNVPLRLRIHEEALPSVDLGTGQAIDASLEPDVLRLTDHHELDLAGTVREAISLAEPIATVCRPDCPGLCPECGESLEAGPHDHPDEPIDPRLEALRGFRVDAADENR